MISVSYPYCPDTGTEPEPGFFRPKSFYLDLPTKDFQEKPIALPRELPASQNQCCGSGMFLPDPNFSHSGSRIRIKEFNYFNPKIVSKPSEI
jgi:hypothetical protein